MNEMVLTVATSVGWIGAVGTVGAYALVSRSRLDANSVRFQSINIVSAGLLSVSALSAQNWPSTVSNLVWAAVGAHALFRARHAVRAAVVVRLRKRRGPAADAESGAGTADVVALAA